MIANGKEEYKVIERRADGTIFGWRDVDLYEDDGDEAMNNPIGFKPIDFVSGFEGGANAYEVVLWEDLEVAHIDIDHYNLKIETLFTLTDSIKCLLERKDVRALAEKAFGNLTGKTYDCSHYYTDSMPDLVSLSDEATRELAKVDDDWSKYPDGLKDYIGDVMMGLVEKMSWLWKRKRNL